MSNRDFLISRLKDTPLQDRFVVQECVNYDQRMQQKMAGNFSLVFKAFDKANQEPVAVKFFDPDRSKQSDPYRIDAFQREPELLKTLLGKRRCLQLVSDMKTFDIAHQLEDSEEAVELSYPYFVTEWTNDRIDDFFLSPNEISELARLELFFEIISAVEAIHGHEVYHRDLKPDNLRQYKEQLKRIVVAIDLGTAARFSSSGLQDQYQDPVGHYFYSSPESKCGLAGDRDLGRLSDYYALGCMLFELFSQSRHGYIVYHNESFAAVITALSQKMMREKTHSRRREVWKVMLSRFSQARLMPSMHHPSVSVSPAVIDLLERILLELTAFDYASRCYDLRSVRRLTMSAIKVLSNEKIAKTRLARKRKIRQARQKRAVEKDKRLAAMPKQTISIGDYQ